MYYVPYVYPYLYPYYIGTEYNYERQCLPFSIPGVVGYVNRSDLGSFNNTDRISLTDYGPKPFVVNINKVSKKNNTYRTVLWTGTHLQVTLMSLNIGEEIGLEMHPNVDQFLRIEQGQGIVQMGNNKYNLNFKKNVYNDSAIMIPAGTWHNLTNTGNVPLKLYSIYAPPNHPFGTVHVTKAEALAVEEGHVYNPGQ